MSAPQFERRRHIHYVGFSQNCDPVPDLWTPPSSPGNVGLWPQEVAPTYSGVLDGARLTSQLDAVLVLMADHQWRTLSEIRAAIGRGSEAGISARLREARATRRGVVERRRRGDPKQGLWEYKVSR